MMSNWFANFWYDGWNLFDFLVVTLSVVALGPAQFGPLKTLRLIRAFKVMRLLKRLDSPRRIVNALSAAIAPVCNALLIVFVILAIYSILGVSFFRDNSYFFSDFLTAALTMFQVSISQPLACWKSCVVDVMAGDDSRWLVRHHDCRRC